MPKPVSKGRNGSRWLVASLLASVVLLSSSVSLTQIRINSWSSSGPDGGAIAALAIDPVITTTVYAAAAGSTRAGVFRSTNAGQTWTAINTGLTSTDVRDLAIHPVTSPILYAATGDGGVFKSSNSGGNWTAINTGLTTMVVRAVAIDPVTPSTLYAGTDIGVFKSTDSGGQWLITGLTQQPIFSLAIDYSNPNTLYAGSIGVFKSTNGGAGWTHISTGIIGTFIYELAIDPVSPQTLFAGTSAGLYKTFNGGVFWIDTGFSRGQTIAIDPVTPSTVYSGAHHPTGGGVYKSTDGGATWIPHNNGLFTYGELPLAMAAGTLYAGSGAGVFKTTNGAQSWTMSSSDLIATDVRSVAVDRLNPSRVFATAWGGGVHRSTNGGINWVLKPSAAIAITTQLAISASNPNVVYAGSDGAGFARTTDGGETWGFGNTAGLSTTEITAVAIDPLDYNTVYFGGGTGGITKTTNGGTTFSPLTQGLPGGGGRITVLAIDPAVPSIVYQGTERLGIFKLDSGVFWFAANNGLSNLNVRAIAIDPVNTNTLYAGTAGGVFKSTDGAANWSAINNGLFSLDVTALAVDTLTPTTLYAATPGSGIFKSVNGGATWGPVNDGLSNTNVSSLAVDPMNPSKVFAGTRGGGVFIATQTTPTFGYALANSGNITVSQGDGGSNTITATLTSGSSEAISFSASGLPAGATAGFDPPGCSPTCTTALTISTSRSTPKGTYTITIKGSPLNQPTTFNLVVNPWHTLTNSGNINLTQGGSAANTITATLSAASPENVSFSAAGLPAGASAVFNPSSCTPSCESMLTISTTSATPTGTHAITVSGNPLGTATTFDLVVAAAFDYRLTSEGNKQILPGFSTKSTVTATHLSGATETVTFSLSPLPAGVRITFDPLGCAPTCTTSLAISTSLSVPAGTYPITVTGNPLSKTTTFDLTVNALPCPAEIAASDANDRSSSLTTLYRLRDEAMMPRADRKRYADLFYKHSLEASWILLTNGELRARFSMMLSQFLPTIRAIVERKPAALRFKEVNDIDALIRAFMQKSSSSLRTDLEIVRQELREGTFQTTFGILSVNN